MDNNIENNNVENSNGTAKKGIQPLTACIILIIVVAITVVISYMVFGKNNNEDVNISKVYNKGEITATASDNGKEASGGKIWTKNYVFVAPKNLKETASTSYRIQEKVIIDYKIYNDLVNQYKLKAAVPTLEKKVEEKEVWYQYLPG